MILTKTISITEFHKIKNKNNNHLPSADKIIVFLEFVYDDVEVNFNFINSKQRRDFIYYLFDRYNFFQKKTEYKLSLSSIDSISKLFFEKEIGMITFSKNFVE